MKALAFAILIPFAAFSQKVENTVAEVVGDQIIITYDLTQGETGDAYTVSLFSSFNNFRAPLTHVTGDVGPGVKAGTGKRIVWDAQAEMGSYRGSVSFEVEAVLVAPLTFKSTVPTSKPGANVSLLWRGGDQRQNVKIELLKGGEVVSEVGSVSNKGMYDWQVPKLKGGKDYALRLVNGNESVTSEPFAIKSKVPVWVWVGVPVVVAGVLLIPKSSSDNPTTDRLPGPPSILN